ncbi:putative disease resistance protein [Vitis vinifera]|uniref:Putative disease resistance protein n=1 Tax=Vitis vinifera TaxID=29760 RepID=A0A438H888_VITVI|nr:putative disease resistance protein [Vitis vinifera]
MKRMDQVQGWLSRVEAMETEVGQLIGDGAETIEEKRLRGCCHPNIASPATLVSKTPNLGRVQNEIWEKVGFCNDKWKSKSRHEKAKDIWRALSKKRFVMSLDDMWEQMDLLEVGIPPPDQQNKSKLIFTTQSQDLCGLMELTR